MYRKNDSIKYNRIVYVLCLIDTTDIDTTLIDFWEGK